MSQLRDIEHVASADAVGCDTSSMGTGPVRHSVGPYRDLRESLVARREALTRELRCFARVEKRADRARAHLAVIDDQLAALGREGDD